jgi:hypothetical protein
VDVLKIPVLQIMGEGPGLTFITNNPAGKLTPAERFSWCVSPTTVHSGQALYSKKSDLFGEAAKTGKM